MKKQKLPFNAFMTFAFKPIMNNDNLSQIEKQMALQRFELVSGGKNARQAHRTGHKHMAYVRKMRKAKARKK